MKRSQPRRDWSLANEKFEAENGRCRNCRTTFRVERAHTIGRTHDQPHPTRKNVLLVNPDDIIPLCGPATDTSTCHGRQHAHKLDLMPLMTLDEQVAAVRAAGGIELARKRLCPSAYRDKVAV